MKPHSLATLKNLILEETGLFFPPEKDYFLVSGASKRAKVTSARDPDEYIRELRRGSAEFQELVNLLTIPETFFIREFRFLDMVARRIVPEIASRRDAVSVLSAGSATGEEIYSLLMLLARHDFPLDKLRAVGLDINTYSLERARAGVFGQFSVRHADEEAKSTLARFISQTGNGEFRVSDEIKRPARFVHGNLFKGVSGFGPFDLVLLRNTLIYIQPGLRPRVLLNIKHSMRDAGYLVLGQVEIAGGVFGLFHQERLKGLTVFVKKEQA